MGAFAALRDPISRTHYDRKIAQGKRHNQALIALARRRCAVLYAMLRDDTLYQPDRRDEKPRCGKLGGIRQWVESVFDTMRG